jgi:DNA-binding FadR family transcriptional regulator
MPQAKLPLDAFRRVRTRKVFEEAVGQIVEAIRTGDFHVGDRLPSERTLAARMEISRPTLREAIKVLVDAGVVEVQPGPAGGVFVATDVVPGGVVEDGTELRIHEVSGVLEARRLFEPRVAQLAGLYGEEADFAELQKTIDMQREHEQDPERFLQLELRFHIGIARATHNTTLIDMQRLLQRRLEIARDVRMHKPHEPEWAIDMHERTLRAIKSGRPDLIEREMDEHLSFLESIWEESTGRARIRMVPDFLVSQPAPAGG